MFEELNNFVGWKMTNLPKNEFILLSSQNTDGSFLLHHFISMFLKSDSNVVFLMAAQTFPHYNIVCSKLGVSLERYVDNGKLKILNLLNACLSSYLGEKTDSHPNLQSGFEKLSIKYIYQEAKKLLTDSFNVIIVDDVSMLLNIGFSENDLINFVHYLSTLCSKNCSIVIHFQKDCTEEANGHYLYENCKHYCSCELLVRGLESGYCKDVHGNLELLTKSKDISRRRSVKTMQYKLTDRNLRLFALGTSAAVL